MNRNNEALNLRAYDLRRRAERRGQGLVMSLAQRAEHRARYNQSQETDLEFYERRAAQTTGQAFEESRAWRRL